MMEQKFASEYKKRGVAFNCFLSHFAFCCSIQAAKRSNYYKMITSLEYKGCNDAIKRIVPKIALTEIDSLIDGIEQLSKLQKEFLKKVLKLRKELMLDVAYAAIGK